MDVNVNSSSAVSSDMRTSFKQNGGVIDYANDTITPEQHYNEYYFFTLYWTNSSESHFMTILNLYIAPILLIVGTLGNLICFLVLHYRLAKKESVYFYMSIYALTNTINLWVATGFTWISDITQTVHVANQADWICRIWKFLSYVTQYTSTWLVVLMVFDRFIYLCVPSKITSLCTVFTAKALSIFVVVLLVAISTHAMWSYGLVNEQSDSDMCALEWGRKDYYTQVWPYVSATFYTYLPVFLIIAMWIAIIINVTALNSPRYQSHDTSQTRHGLTRLVVVISTTFLLLGMPMAAMNIIYNLLMGTKNHQKLVRLIFSHLFCTFMFKVLCAITFPQYFLPQKRLRRELCEYIYAVCRCERTAPSSDHTANGTCIELNTGQHHQEQQRQQQQQQQQPLVDKHLNRNDACKNGGHDSTKENGTLIVTNV